MKIFTYFGNNICGRLKVIKKSNINLITFEKGDEMKIIKIFLLCIIFSFIVGCGDEPGKPTDNNSDLLPLKVGNQWTYIDSSVNAQGTHAFVETKTYEIIKDSIWNEEKMYMFNRSDFLDIHLFGYFLNRSDGTYLFDSNNIANEPQMFIKFPVYKNNGFKGYTDFLIAANIDTAYTTPAGVFNCIMYASIRSDKNNSYYIHYFCPGIGNIASEYYFKNIGEDYHLVRTVLLTSYNLKY